MNLIFFFINPKNIISKYKMLLAVMQKSVNMLKTTVFKFFKLNCIFKFLTVLPIILLSDVQTFFSNKYFIFAINVLIDADLFVCSDNNGSLSSDFFLSIRRELLKGCRVINICSILVSLAIVSWYSEMSPLSKDITELLNHRLSPKHSNF